MKGVVAADNFGDITGGTLGECMKYLPRRRDGQNHPGLRIHRQRPQYPERPDRDVLEQDRPDESASVFRPGVDRRGAGKVLREQSVSQL